MGGGGGGGGGGCVKREGGRKCSREQVRTGGVQSGEAEVQHSLQLMQSRQKEQTHQICVDGSSIMI
jgi:hypothetical protein